MEVSADEEDYIFPVGLDHFGDAVEAHAAAGHGKDGFHMVERGGRAFDDCAALRFGEREAAAVIRVDCGVCAGEAGKLAEYGAV